MCGMSIRWGANKCTLYYGSLHSGCDLRFMTSETALGANVRAQRTKMALFYPGGEYSLLLWLTFPHIYSKITSMFHNLIYINRLWISLRAYSETSILIVFKGPLLKAGSLFRHFIIRLSNPPLINQRPSIKTFIESISQLKLKKKKKKCRTLLPNLKQESL